MVVSTLKPDIVIVDRKNRTASIFELTCPAEHRIETANRLKEHKYIHFQTDIKHFKTTVAPFEVGSNTGFITKSNKARLASLHKYCKKSVKLKNFEKNISAIIIPGSYFIFNCRSQDLWPEMAPILAPFPNQ